MADLGRAALIVSFGLALYAFLAGTVAALEKRRRLGDSARNAMFACFGSTVVAAIVLVLALVHHNFSFVYVADHTSRSLSTVYSLTAFWGGQEGSLLLWLLVLTGYGALAVALNRKVLHDLIAWVVPIIAAISAFFSFVLVAVASPFQTQTPPVDGAGLVPSLQNPYMVAHPPMLYLGYVGLTVPFAFAASAMISGHTDERWIVATRRWTLTAWMFLGFGQILGAHWAYVEVGWGGYYAWDPVENAALMPFLVATAFLHSVMIQERKGMLRIWNMVLIALAFELAVFGDFLTRSGVIASIHSFAQSPIGGWFLGFVVATTLFSMTLILWRLPLLRARTKLESALSREAVFLYNNLLLVALALAILWGVIWPIMSDLILNQSRTLSRPYYDFFLRLFGLPLLFLMGVGPLIAWRRTSVRGLLKTIRWPFGAALIAGAVLIALGAGSSKPGIIGYTFCVFVLATIVVELVRGTRATRSLIQLVTRNRRRYGGYIVHFSIVLFAIGVIGSSAYSTTHEEKLIPGQSMTVAGHTVRYDRLEHKTISNGHEVSAVLTLSGDVHGQLVTSVIEDNTVGESKAVGIQTDYLRAEDTYTILDGLANKGNGIFLIVLVKPLVNLIWLAGFIFLGASLFTLWPDAAEQRRLAARFALVRA